MLGSSGRPSSFAARVVLGSLLLSTVASQRVDAAGVGMVVNAASGSVTVFDQSTHAVLGNVAIGTPAEFDCTFDSAARIGYVGDFAGHVTAIDVGAAPPALASGNNPMVSSIPIEDIAITPDHRFVLACDGAFAGVDRISVLDVTTRMEVSTFQLSGGGCQGIDVCEDGSVLAVQTLSTLHRLTIDPFGVLTEHEVLPYAGAFNTICGKGGTTAVAISFNGSIQSFALPDLTPIATSSVPEFGARAGVANAKGDRIYIRTDSHIYGFDFNPTTGALGATPFVTIQVASITGYYGIEPLALNAAGTELFVSELDAVKIYSATSGAFVDVITDPAIRNPNGVCATSAVCGDGTVEGVEDCDDGNLIDGDGCDSNCTLTACGNGVVTVGEECDDGNLDNGDCCSSVCTAAVDGTLCTDALFCNGSDTCTAGVCVHSGDPCSGGADCDDHCNEATHNCLAPAGTACTDDGNICTSDECDGFDAACTHPNLFFTPCDDGVFCNGNDLCLSGTCQLHEGDPCVGDTCANRCDELSATCLATTSGTPCFEDGNECTNDACDGLGACAHPPKSSGTSCTDDGNVCTDDLCDGVSSCGHPPVPNGTACNDGSACTQTDACQAGLCVGANPIICPLSPCYEPAACDPSSGTCTTCPDGYTLGGGGCQKSYAIDASLLRNQASSCDSSGTRRYNDCSSPFGFHWTDTAAAEIGDVIGVEISLQTGIDCDTAAHAVSFNAAIIGSYPATNACVCVGSIVSRTFTAEPPDYVKGGINVVDIDAQACTGLSDPQGQFALVTVTYADPGPLPSIRNDCRSALESKLKYKNNSNDGADVLNWKWKHGAQTSQDDLADPTDTADYEFCVYGERSATVDVLLAAQVPQDATHWAALDNTGYRYKEKSGAQGGITKIVAKGGLDGKSKLIVKGKGAALSDPALPLAPGTSGIRVQLTNTATNICWESEFPFGMVSVDDTRIKAKIP